ncbi:MAG: hypothetical protein ACI9SJ_001171 [Flavobacteriaceae bacterium]|jgi:hypothetical protein|uniref:acyloxyacyl hydrolase n=1 Tax=Candidatus Marifrigoribacter sp. Uisw_064 TaxID=3230970 RepID=UPI003AE49286
MQKTILLILTVFISTVLYSQSEENEDFTIDANYFYGSILRHNKDISHLITEHPQGFIFSYNNKSFGSKRWQRSYNYPDWGVSFLYHNSNNETLGNNFGMYAHLNFYFLKRNLLFRVSEGLVYNTNPFDIETNFKNNAYGSHLLLGTTFLINYSKENIVKNIGLQAGLTFLHFSNANVKAPNTSTNTLAFNIGLKYTIQNEEQSKEYKVDSTDTKYTEPIQYNIVLRGGVNESDYLNLGQHPFFIVSAFADKRVSYKSSLQLGMDVFFSKFLEKEIEYLSVAFPNFNIKGDEDYKRVGVFIGHDLHFGKFAINTQIGYYVYYPYDFEGRVYQRVGVNYNVYKNLFSSIGLKSHGAKAEAVEIGIGIRL